ncbi:bifunctional 4-hydroxy-2-oxoglutarate aldolase/2-dehydro-3-deoxy-phosphogluconate aldolase [Metallibacterium sp.]|uniref:bifunctional 4-hydroxy-2-oxoglutarate aldolase/2-dehydro-3-deoxy-phosphogluconate aldolase n=1 Tax=Metallibacterium sp. TaxID=2940281 RepID=UPI00260FB61B|nr:bifunctional 4-hydroxy-2-oxoglutarate aldolase/2-dehydro-3-deoxy-phosphogluconate aldolase [Metallibacterium sp.]
MNAHHDIAATLAERQQQALQLLRRARIMPVLSLASVEQGLACAKALAAGGLTAIEITLRTPAALAAIRAIRDAGLALTVGAGTVLDAAQLDAAIAHGAEFIVTPGTPPALADALQRVPLPVIPGAATASEIMALHARGFRALKFFPAASSGGVAALKALRGPFAELHFCPTGGIGEHDAADYLALPNVPCVGGSWMVNKEWLDAGDWAAVTASARRSMGG